MKPKATYECGHESTKEFDCRSSIARSMARDWPEEAAKRDCPKCRKAKILFRINTMTVDQLRQILRDLATNHYVAAAVEHAQ